MHPKVHSHSIYDSQDLEATQVQQLTIRLRRCEIHINTMEVASDYHIEQNKRIEKSISQQMLERVWRKGNPPTLKPKNRVTI